LTRSEPSGSGPLVGALEAWPYGTSPPLLLPLPCRPWHSFSREACPAPPTCPPPVSSCNRPLHPSCQLLENATVKQRTHVHRFRGACRRVLRAPGQPLKPRCRPLEPGAGLLRAKPAPKGQILASKPPGSDRDRSWGSQGLSPNRGRQPRGGVRGAAAAWGKQTVDTGISPRQF
jgi:hypothetical protein